METKTPDELSAIYLKILENRESAVGVFKEALQKNPEFRKEILIAVMKLFFDLMSGFHSKLLDIGRPPWLSGQTTELSPKQFDQAVSKVLSQIKHIMKVFYGIGGHRPQKNSARDLKIWKLRQEHPNWSLSQIGRAAGGLKANAVSVALLRQKRRVQDRDAAMGRFVELLLVSIKQALDERNLETNALPQGPTVQ
jgi:hypothetical protein